MSREKVWLDATIKRWEKIRQLADKRLTKYRELRAQLDEDLDELLRELGDEEPRNVMANREDGDNLASVGRTGKTPDKPVELAKPETVQEDRRDEEGAADSQEDERVVRGRRNPNRLMILALTDGRSVTVPRLRQEMTDKGQPISIQSVDSWVKKLLAEGLLVRENSEEAGSKYQYRRSDKRDDETIQAEDPERPKPRIASSDPNLFVDPEIEE